MSVWGRTVEQWEKSGEVEKFEYDGKVIIRGWTSKVSNRSFPLYPVPNEPGMFSINKERIVDVSDIEDDDEQRIASEYYDTEASLNRPLNGHEVARLVTELGFVPVEREVAAKSRLDRLEREHRALTKKYADLDEEHSKWVAQNQPTKFNIQVQEEDAGWIDVRTRPIAPPPPPRQFPLPTSSNVW